MSISDRFRLPKISINLDTGWEILKSEDARRNLSAQAAVIFEKVFGRYGTSKIDSKGIFWKCDEKPQVTAGLEFKENSILMEIKDDFTLAGSLAALYFIVLFTVVFSIMSLDFFFYMYAFFFYPKMLADSVLLWNNIDRQIASLKTYIILAWAVLPVAATFIVMIIRRIKIFRFMKKGAAELHTAFRELLSSPGSDVTVNTVSTGRKFFDIRLNGTVKQPEGYDPASDKKGYEALHGAINEFLRIGQFFGNVSPDMDECFTRLNGYDRRLSIKDDFSTSVTLYYYRDTVEIEAREDHGLAWLGMGARLTAIFLFMWLVFYAFAKSLIMELIGNVHYYRAGSLHAGVLFTGFPLILAVSMLLGFAYEAYIRNQRYKTLRDKFRKLLGDSEKIINS